MDKKIIRELAAHSSNGSVFVPDLSIITEGQLSKLVSDETVKGTIIVHNAILSVLEYDARKKMPTGFFGIDELRKIKSLESGKKIVVEYAGEPMRQQEQRFSRVRTANALVRELAASKGAVLVTSDEVQNELSEAIGLKTIFAGMKKELGHLSIEKYFDDSTMSVHLREGTTPKAKKGKPGEWRFEEIGKDKLTAEEIEKLAKEITEKARIDRESFVEIERGGSTIIQYRNYRTVITRPPLSDGWEITCVRPVKMMRLEDYKISDKLNERLKLKAEGILIAGAPGNGKSTFCQALAIFYSENDKIVKTIESPRDLILPPEITQYSKNIGTNEEIHDILLLSRPDYTLIDEIRNTQDFELFKDLRLSGVGMAGVIHATNPIDAIQRFIGRVELGMVPSIIDTVIFIDKGNVGKVLELSMTVRVPAGMTEADLARPIIEVTDFFTKKVEYEMYTFGEQTVVVPVKNMPNTLSPAREMAKTTIEARIKAELPKGTPIAIEVPSETRAVLYVPKDLVPQIIGKQGKNVEQLEKKVGIKLDIRTLGDNSPEEVKEEFNREERGEIVEYDASFEKKSIVFTFDEDYAAKSLDFFIDDEYLFTATVSKKGEIKVGSKTDLGRKLLNAKAVGKNIVVTLQGEN